MSGDGVNHGVCDAVYIAGAGRDVGLVDGSADGGLL